MQNKFALIWVAATALHVVSASAENISESFTRIEAETLVLKARERQLEIQSTSSRDKTRSPSSRT
ncbi:hypothetical protein [Herbaspirillum sp. B65]|uniref:hypothetical protein n=1 Tax=Herbaspirillum sp. B65 TaxID=137708 RepID=UPI002091972C|nr:hypothetical protein [Herbaspirillum sp. B65]